MNIRELSREQLQELKCRYYAQDKDISYMELAYIDNYVSDEEVFEEYDGIMFTEEDFFMTTE